MPRWVFFAFFFVASVLILGGVHYYFYRRLVVAPALPASWRTIAIVALVALALAFPISFFVVRRLDAAVGRFVLYPVYIWLGVMMMLFFLLLSIDLVRGLIWLGQRIAGHDTMEVDAARRQLVARAIAGGAGATVLVATGWSLWQGLGRLVVKRVEVVVPKLPAALDGFTIAQLTDLHLGAMRSAPWLEQVVQRTLGLEPDLIAITGDLADAPPDKLPEELAVLRKLVAPEGVFFVTGNHEYFYDLPGWLRQLTNMGVRVLRNEHVEIRRDGASFDLAGVDDHDGQRMASGHGPSVERAMRGHDPDQAAVLLAHQPRVIHDACRHGVGLVLCGHTHGGQIFPWNYLVLLQQPYVSGLHDHDGTKIYVSEGTGFWGPPMRLGSSSEITQIVLRSPSVER